ncbi:MAG: indolepyruvate ferredoxin oxidoreductase subunit alpha [Bacillota bacterium]
MQKELLLGNEAIARGAKDAGCRVAVAYPGTPSTEITETIAKLPGVDSAWAPNEKVALEVAAGASIGGARALCCMKHVGLNVAADPMFTAAYTGVNAGLVIVVADDPGMHSSQNEQDSRYYALSAHVPMLEPSDSQEAYDFTRLAFEMSEIFDTPVLVRITTRIAHARSQVVLNEAVQADIRDYAKNAAKYVMMPAMARARHVMVEEHMQKLAEYAETLPANVEIPGDNMGIVTSGIAYQYVREALPGASVFKLGMVHPLPLDRIRAFADKVDALYVVEELEPFIENVLKAAGIRAEGKSVFPSRGELSANLIAQKLAGTAVEHADAPRLPVRPPVMCPGCPHRAVYYLLGKLKLTATGDIGCYTLGALPPLNGIDTCLCMGASIPMALGMEKARGREFARSLVAVIGDSTFVHSGITGLIEAAYEGGTFTVLILDNATTGMTGHQNHPATGYNIRGEAAPRIDLEVMARAAGAEHVTVVDPFNLKTLESTLRAETSREALSVVICRRPCALLGKTQQPPLTVQEDRCRYCKACMKLGCPAIEDAGGKVRIDANICNGCGLCTGVCAFSAIGAGGAEA